MSQDSIGVALKAPNLIWETGGDAPWIQEKSIFYLGQSAVQSGSITNSQQSWLQTVVNGPGTLSFWARVSCELEYDFLEFYIDGKLQPEPFSGELDWQKHTYGVENGVHSLRWKYVKDNLFNDGYDATWLDSISFVQDQ